MARAIDALLRTLAEFGPGEAGELPRRSHMGPGATVSRVAALEADGLVERSRGIDGAWLTLVSLTSLGAGVCRDIVEVRIDHLVHVLADWSPEECAQRATLVDRLVVVDLLSASQGSGRWMAC